MLLILTACSSSNDCLEEPQPVVPESESDFTLMSFTRANNALTIEEEFASIGMFLVGSDTQHKQFHYRQNDHRWHSNIEITAGQGYRLYAYAPADAVTAAISEESAAGVTMTFTQLPTVSSQDICFAVGVQHMTEANGTKDIKLGQFSFTGGAQDHNFVNLLMDHLYAGIKLQMTIDNDYAQLRTINIRKLELKSTNSAVQAAVTLASNTENTDPVQAVIYSGLSGTERIVTFFESTEGVALNADNITTPRPLEAMCCFVPTPTLSGDLTLVTTYDVYDKNGNRIGERTASNKLPNMEAGRGDCVTLTLKVSPTYLYVLSDPDLDNPTITVN
jgi:hypothetical protein